MKCRNQTFEARSGFSMARSTFAIATCRAKPPCCNKLYT